MKNTIPADQIVTESDRQWVKDGGYWDEDDGKRKIRFVEKYMRPRGGRLAKKKFNLFKWQRDLLMRLFCMKNADGTRRFRVGYISCARQNGKSFLCAAICLIMMLIDGEDTPAVASAATCRRQAGIIYSYIRKSLLSDDELRASTHRKDSQRRIEIPATDGSFESLSCEGKHELGPSYSCVILDEYAFHPSDELAANLEPSLAARDNPLILSITTASTNFNSPGFAQYQYARKVASSQVVDTSFFHAIYEADDNAKVDDPAQWAKANPSLAEGLVTQEELRRASIPAKHSKAKELHFRYFRLNRYTAGINNYYNVEKWESCQGPFPDLSGKSIYLALDASKSKDLCAITGIIPHEGKYYTIAHAWVPQAAYDSCEANTRETYEICKREGTLTIVPGNGSDTTLMREKVYEWSKRYKVESVFYDPNYMHETAAELVKRRFNLVRFSQSPANYTGPVKALETMIADGKIVHDGSELLRYQIGCTAVDASKDDKLMPRKGKSSGKIDNVICLLMCIASATSHEAKKVESSYQHRGIRWIG